MKRILIANGSFSSLVLASLLQGKLNAGDNNFFLGYFKNTSLEKSKALFAFFNYLITAQKNLNFFDYKSSFNFDFKKLDSDLGEKDIDEIYIPINSRTKQIYKSFKKHYGTASFIFYEEGLMSYVKPLLDFSLRKIMRKNQNYYIFYHEKLRNLLLKSFPFINFQTITKDSLLESIRTIQKTLLQYDNKIKLNMQKEQQGFIKAPHADKYVLVLPQYYFEKNAGKTKKIINMYYENIQRLITEGYTVIFKDHPKAALKYSAELKPCFSPQSFLLFEDIMIRDKLNLTGSNEILKILEILPVEVVAEKIKINAVFSVYSTSLFTFKHLFNIDPLTDIKMLDYRINIFSLYPTLSALLVKNTLALPLKNTNFTVLNNAACTCRRGILYTDNIPLKIIIMMLKLIHKYKE
ncbi:MAG: alpha-2,8-polysialyltransferase family protein [Alphaproteobacteria bacterium]|nr:alpha-2,8-polysialyltransferase family protein [Alphaproteobacteria bacterium]